MNRSIIATSSLIRKYKKKPFSVCLIEDNKLYLQGLVYQIKNSIPNIKLSGFSKSSTFMQNIKHKPEIAIVDFNLDERSEIEGIELIQELKAQSPKTKIIVLTGEKSKFIEEECRNEGVFDYVIKEDKAIETIAEEIKSIMGNLLKEMEKRAFNNRLRLMAGVALTIILIIIYLNVFNPRALE